MQLLGRPSFSVKWAIRPVCGPAGPGRRRPFPARGTGPGPPGPAPRRGLRSGEALGIVRLVGVAPDEAPGRRIKHDQSGPRAQPELTVPVFVDGGEIGSSDVWTGLESYQ